MDNLIAELKRTQEQIKSLSNKEKKLKNQIINNLEKRGRKNYTIENVDNKTTATIIEKVNISYNINNLKNKLDKSLLAKIIDKKYEILDFEIFKTLFKKLGGKPSQIKSVIEVEETINKNMINELFEKGDITKEDLKGCYDASLTKYLMVKSHG